MMVWRFLEPVIGMRLVLEPDIQHQAQQIVLLEAVHALIVGI
jgi:hypothetical protein